jgi:hypothetical protein
MKQYLEVFLLLLLFYLVVQLIRSDKDKIVEGIGPIEEEPSTAEDPETILIIEEEDTEGTACTVADYNGRAGVTGYRECDTENGTPSGLKYNDDVSRCDCVCGDGYRTGTEGCVESTNLRDFTCFDECQIQLEALRFKPEKMCDYIDSMKDGCGCTVEGGGTEKSETTFKNEIYKFKDKLGCVVSDEEFIGLISDLPKLITMSAILDLPGFTYLTFIQLSSVELKMYTDESIMNQNHLKNQIIVKLDETCLEGVSASECMRVKDKETRDIFGNLRDKTVLDFDNVDDFINVSFKLLVIITFGQLAYKIKREGKSEETSQQIQHAFTVISEFVKLFEKKDDFDQDYQEHVGKMLEEAKKSSDVGVNAMTTTTFEEKRLRGKASGSYISNLFGGMVSENLKTKFTVKGLLCRGGAGTGIDGAIDIDKIHLPRNIQNIVEDVKGSLKKDPEECNKQYCIGNTDITKDHICPRLKYLKWRNLKSNWERIEGNTDDKCCDISFVENIWFTIQDLFYF